MDVKNNNQQTPRELKESLKNLASKIDAITSTYEITREELFALLSDVLDGNING